MKNTMREIFDACTEEELEDLLAGIEGERTDELTLKRVETAALKKAGLAGKRTGGGERRWLRWAAAAACLVLALGTGTFAYAAEIKEYNEAVEFFIRNDLSAEGLTRAELKAVYRDITTNSFTYKKTGEVLNSGRVDVAMAGMNITPSAPPATPEELRQLWENKGNKGDKGAAAAYRIRWDYKLDPDLDLDVLDKSILEHYEGEQLVWSAEFARLYANDFREVSDGVLVWGYTYRWSSGQNSYPWMAKVSKDGETLWEIDMDHGFRSERIQTLLEDADGTCAVFSRGESELLIFTRLSPDGEELLTRSTSMGAPYGIWGVAHLGEDYVVHLGNNTLDAAQRIVKVDREGNMTDEFRYSADDCWYFISDMAEFGGKLYLSAHSVPALPDGEGSAGGRYEIAAVLNEIFERQMWSTEDGRLSQTGDRTVLDMMREHFTAVLLVCDPASGTPETFYTVRGAIGGALTAEDGRLVWDVEQFINAKFSPATSAWSIWTDCQVLRCAFDKAGTLTEQTQTEETTVFAR